MDSYPNSSQRSRHDRPPSRWRKALIGFALVAAGILTGQTALIVHPDALPALILLPESGTRGGDNG